MIETRDQESAIRVKSTKVIKLKDNPASRRIIYLDFQKAFSFIPENIIIEKADGHDKFIVHAVLTAKEIEIEDKARKAEEKQEKDTLKTLEAKK